MYYLIKAKAPGQAKAQALDLSEGIQVSRLIYATILTKPEAEAVVAKLAEENPDWTFRVEEVH